MAVAAVTAIPQPRPKVLLAEDDRAAALVLSGMIEAMGFDVRLAGNGAEAFALLREEAAGIDIVVTDRMMPVMDGLALTRRIKREPDLQLVPVVLLTGADRPEDVAAGVEAGAFYYATKPPQENILRSVLESALREVGRQKKLRREIAGHQAGFRNIEAMRLKLGTPDEVEPVCSLMASLSDDPQKLIQGIYELVQNAVEHGVLRFGLEQKQRLLEEGRWREALAGRATDPAYRGEVEASIARQDGALVLRVKDSGPGFAWRRFLQADPARSGALCGRGIARAGSFVFARMAFNEAGNEVTAVFQNTPKVVW